MNWNCDIKCSNEYNNIYVRFECFKRRWATRCSLLGNRLRHSPSMHRLYTTSLLESCGRQWWPCLTSEWIELFLFLQFGHCRPNMLRHSASWLFASATLVYEVPHTPHCESYKRTENISKREKSNNWVQHICQDHDYNYHIQIHQQCALHWSAAIFMYLRY